MLSTYIYPYIYMYIDRETTLCQGISPHRSASPAEVFRVYVFAFRGSGLGIEWYGICLRGWGLGCVLGSAVLGFKDPSLRLRVLDVGFGVEVLVLRAKGSDFGVQGATQDSLERV